MYAFALWAAIVFQRLDISSSCGTTLNGSGYIQSPNFPERYNDNLNCLWTLVAQPSNGTIFLDMIVFRLEDGYDYLSIVHSNGTILHKFSGTNASSVIFLGNFISVKFETDRSVANIGFVIRFTTKVTASFSSFSPNVTTWCDIVSATIDTFGSTPWNMQPTSVVFSIKATQSGWSTTKRLDYSSRASINFLGNASTTYSVWVTPETCLPSTSCITDPRRGQSSSCVQGRETVITTARTSALEYEMKKDRNFISVKIFSPQECPFHQATMFNGRRNTQLTCTRINDGTKYTIPAWPHELDPRYNYTCALIISYGDDSREAARASFNIETADFSKNHLIVNTTCDFLFAKLNNWRDSHWDVEPSFVVFSMQAYASGQVATQRIAYDSAHESVKFPVDPNTTYNVWAAPETCWPKMPCAARLTKECYNSSSCFSGRKTAIMTVTTMVQEYELEKEVDVVFVKNKSPQKCPSPQKIMASCQTFQDYGCPSNASTQDGHICFRNVIKYYNCNLEVLLNNGRTMRTTFTFTFDEETKKSDFSFIIAATTGGMICFVLLVALITTFVTMKRRSNPRSSLNNCTGNTNLPTRYLELAVRQEEEGDDVLYANVDSAYNEPQHARSCNNESHTEEGRSKCNAYTS